MIFNAIPLDFKYDKHNFSRTNVVLIIYTTHLALELVTDLVYFISIKTSIIYHGIKDDHF